MPAQIIPFPQDLRPRLPTIVGNVDYRLLRQRLEQIDSLLISSGTERKFIELSLERWSKNSEGEPNAKQQSSFQRRSQRALRCNLLRTLLQEDVRSFSCTLAGNPLFQWFCHIDAIDKIRVPSKSELQRFAHWLPEPQMAEVLHHLLRAAIEKPDTLRLKEALNMDDYFADSTCIKADIHFPTDWVLLRDGVRTLMKATLLIRKAGLKRRMESPEGFLTRMNRLAMEMSQQSRRCGARRERKRVLRKMKRLVGVVRAHARRHRELLDQGWKQTEWTRKQVEQILRRIDRVLELLPRAQKQAHERIIGNRPVANAEKILSLYDTDVRVIVRGKAGAEVEFGNTLLLGENRQGVILDWRLFRDRAPADSQVLFESLLRIEEKLGKRVKAVATDRGFASAANKEALTKGETFDATCPRNPQELRERMKEPRFAEMQRRRGQTEARISILKRGFLGQPLRSKGFEHRELALTWGVLTHNLWMLGRMMKERKAGRIKRALPPARAAA